METAGITTYKSQYTVKETIDLIAAFLLDHGVTIYARIDQQAEAAAAGTSIPPLNFILFGNPRAGGPVMAANPMAALDLPLKIIAWEDEEHQVWLAYNKAGYLQERYQLPPELTGPLNLEPVIAKALI